jgi:hypothetical protein
VDLLVINITPVATQRRRIRPRKKISRLKRAHISSFQRVPLRREFRALDHDRGNHEPERDADLHRLQRRKSRFRFGRPETRSQTENAVRAVRDDIKGSCCKTHLGRRIGEGGSLTVGPATTDDYQAASSLLSLAVSNCAVTARAGLWLLRRVLKVKLMELGLQQLLVG